MKATLTAAVSGATPGIAAANELCVACVGMLGVDGAAVSMVFGGQSQGTYGSSNELSRRLDEYQFTFGEGPCLDAVKAGESVLVDDLDSPQERRWPAFAGAALDHGVRGVFALPVTITSACVGALDLFREGPGPLREDELVGALLAAELASLPLLDLISASDADTTLEDRLLVVGPDSWGPLADMDRVEVYQATGMLIAQLDIAADEALVRLRAHALATGQTASQVAWAIVERNLVLDQDGKGGAGGYTR